MSAIQQQNHYLCLIRGCWEVADVSHIIESNFVEFDRYAMQEKERRIDKRLVDSYYVSKYTKDKRYVFKKTGKEFDDIRKSNETLDMVDKFFKNYYI